MAQLKNEFRNILTRQTDLFIGLGQSSSITDSTSYELREEYYMNMAYDGLSKDAISVLRNIAGRMKSAGHIGDCVEVYRSVRKPFVDTSFRRLGIEELSAGDVRRIPWDELKTKIELWIHAAEVCIRILFAREKQLSDQIFKGLGNVTHDVCFVETIRDAASQLFNFARAVSTGRPSFNKLFKVLDLYKALLNLLPDINALFALDSAHSIQTEAEAIVSCLEEFVRGILSDFVTAVVKEMSGISDNDRGAIHSFAKIVMDYISRILVYEKTLTGLIIVRPVTNFGDLIIPDVEFVQLEGPTPLALHLVLIIAVLRFKLQAKSKFYEDASLGHLFTANNVHYIVQHIQGFPELRKMIGENYLEKLNSHLGEAMICYQSSTCKRMLHILRLEGLQGRGCFFSGVSESALRRRINSFNAMFEEVQSTQATWAVPDLQLRAKLRLSISDKLIPAYESFLEQYVGSRKHPFIKYSVEDLQNLILNNFLAYDHRSSSPSGRQQEFILGRKVILPKLGE